MSTPAMAAPVQAQPARTGLWGSLRRSSAPQQGALIAAVCVATALGAIVGRGAYLGPAGLFGGLANATLVLLGITIAGYTGAGLFGGVTALVRLALRRRPRWSPRVAQAGFYSGLMMGGFGGSTLLLMANGSIKPLYFLPSAVALVAVPVFLGLCIGLLAGGRGRRPVAALLLAVAVVLNVALGGFLWYRPSYAAGAPGWAVPAGVTPIGAADPGLPGPYKVQQLTYGSGTDRRPEFGKFAVLKTPTVDITPMRPDYPGLTGAARRWVWGFDYTAAPVGGRVWYPDGAGPFPLVLFVHGNHAAEDDSDPGYAYLGELLASRGFIFVSVDMNYLNGDWITQATGEMGVRGYMLLRHIGVWQEWNGTPGNPFYGKVDLNNIAVGGHSRGGEAAAVAAVLGKQETFPGADEVKLGFNYSIKAVLSFAPSDHQWEPNKVATVPRDVNYFVIQGGRDVDAFEFMGICQYQRVAFSGDGDYFKAALWVDNINHGLLNTTWIRDHFAPADWFLNEAPLMDGEVARRIAATFSSAFLEASLHGNRAYLPLLRDYRTGAAWLPAAKYATLFHDTSHAAVADFDEDTELETLTVPGDGGLAKAEGLLVIEQRAPLRELGWRRETQSALLKWPVGGGQPQYTLTLPDRLPGKWRPLMGASLTFALADGISETQPHAPVDLTVELEDRDGKTARVALSRYGAPLRRPDFPITQYGLWDKGWPRGAHGPVLETFTMPLTDFAGIDVTRLKAIRFLFDKVPEGEVYLDDVGFRWNP
ncbi:MAG TPA: hypothetical protein VD969_24785 [Symbiobacteriaceae bacterium]|nr:hypothetical protein [Symbiobacteriaceae bacterium]